MLNLLRKKPRTMLGIDIRSTCIHLVELSWNKRSCYIQRYGSAKLFQENIEEDTSYPEKAIADAINQVLTANHITTQQAILSVPDSVVINTIIQVSKGTREEEIEEWVIMEAERLISYPIHEISFDYKLLGPSRIKTDMWDVMVVVSRASNIHHRVAAATAAGISVAAIDVESYAVQRLIGYLLSPIQEEMRDKLIAVVDVDENRTRLFFLHELKVIFCREEVTERALGEGITSEAVGINLLLQIKRAFQFFFSISGHRTVERLILSGSVSTLPQTASWFQKKLSLPVDLLNLSLAFPWQEDISLSKKAEISLSLLLACGLALKPIPR